MSTYGDCAPRRPMADCAPAAALVLTGGQPGPSSFDAVERIAAERLLT